MRLEGKIGIIGLGNMGRAIAAGLIDLSPAGFDPSRKAMRCAEKLGVRRARDNRDLVQHREIIILAVKPQEIRGVLEEICPVAGNKLFISIAAGITTKLIERFIEGRRVIRAMPNIAMLAGESATALCRGRYASAMDQKIAEQILGRMGRVFRVSEKHIDVVTALSGSGPAYFFELIADLIKAGTGMGLGRQVSEDLVVQTAKGAISLLEKTGRDPGKLRDMVASKKGTTIEALRVFRKYGLEKIVFRAVSAARKRAGQISILINARRKIPSEK